MNLLDRITFDPGAKELSPIPWPEGKAPSSPSAPRGEAKIPSCDVLIVTWTAAEARALADVLTPGVQSEDWSYYKTDYDSYVSELTDRSPARDEKRLGSWCLTHVSGKRVCCFKSELHPATDGPEIPAARLIAQVAAECGAKTVITTGTAGGAGDGTQLGDVNVARAVGADFTTTLKGSPLAGKRFATTELYNAQTDALEGLADLLAANAARIPDQARPAQVWQGDTVSTDFFAFDTETDVYGLRKFDPDIRAVEMDDAPVVAQLDDVAAASGTSLAVFSVRNASDPVMPGQNIAQDKKTAEKIYEDYGYYTTVNSAIVCWALVCGLS